MKQNKWKWLQLFAEGTGDGGAGASGDSVASATGDTGVAAGHQRLLELGVPADKIRKNRAYKVGAPRNTAAVAKQQASAEQPTGQAAAAEQDQPTEGQQTGRMSWKEIMADPEYNQEMQKIIQGRLAKNGQDAENFGKMQAANRALAMYYGLDPDNIDYGALAQKISGDDAFVEKRALQNGVDTSIQRKLDEFNAMKARDAHYSQEQMRKQMLQQHYQGLQTQAAAMKQAFPNFDLDKELQNPEFARLVGPGVNVPVDKAYKLCHQEEIMTATAQAAQKQTAQALANAIRSGSMRPEENGSSGQAPSVQSFDYRKATKEQREALKQRIRSAGQRGEYIYPGKR